MPIEFNKLDKPFLKFKKVSANGAEIEFTFQKMFNDEVTVTAYSDGNEIISFKCSSLVFSRLNDMNLLNDMSSMYFASTAPTGLVY